MPPLKLRDGKAISLDSNLPLNEFPDELKLRLADVLADVRAFLKGRDNFPERGTILADEQGKRAMVRDLDIDEFALVYIINGFLESIRKDGKLGAVLPLRSEPWPRRRGDEEQELDALHNNKVDGRQYKILGKYVDYEHD